MKLERVHIKNYRGLKDVEIPLSQFVCITGQNNAGKSSILQAVSHFFNGPVLKETDYFDPQESIVIEVTFGNVCDDDLNMLADEHRDRIRAIVATDGKLTLVRRYGSDRRSEFGSMTYVPTDTRFASDSVAKLVEKKQGKKLKDDFLLTFPELADQVQNATSQKAVVALIEDYGNSLPNEQKAIAFRKLPTGIDESVMPMLPEVIYIPAVKDLTDETKTAQTSSFGKILAIVMKAIEPLLAEEQELFDRLSKKLNRSFNPEGIELPGRLKQLAQIEEMIQQYVRQSFANIHLEIQIPPPELKSVLSTARILADDGVKGPVEFKGDGLRRAVVFSILRAYVDLSRQSDAIEGSQSVDRGYLLLFEEPELFLHPDAQRILFDALEVFSEKHHVVVTTHSPLFLGPGPTATFIRLFKTKTLEEAKPFTKASHANMDGIDLRDEFQLIGFESNNAAFFAKRIVLVEGDCDYMVFPHIASTLRAEWNCRSCSIAFIRVGGKGNFKRYRSFFKRFDVPVYVISDLDALEADSFSLLEPSDKAKQLHSILMHEVSACLQHGEVKTPKTNDIKSVQTSYGPRVLWENVRAAKLQFDADANKFEELNSAVATFFAWEKKSLYRECIRTAADPAVKIAKMNLIWELRKNNTFILELGEVENYYPPHITGEKLQKALAFKTQCTSVDWLCGLSPLQTCPDTGNSNTEFEFICSPIFSFPQ